MTGQNVAAIAVSRAYEAQPAWFRRKSTLINVLQGLGWLLGALTTVAASWPEWAVLLIGGLSTLVAAGLSALTKGEITPSMAERVGRFSPEESAAAVLSPGGANAGDYMSYIASVGVGESHTPGEVA